MLVRVLIERQVKPGKETEAQNLIVEMRESALQQSGYVSGETLEDVNDPRCLVIISTWHAIEDWQRWESSENHRGLISRINPLLDSQANVRICVNPWDALSE